MVEEARLESVYTPKGYRGFESPFLRNTKKQIVQAVEAGCRKKMSMRASFFVPVCRLPMPYDCFRRLLYVWLLEHADIPLADVGISAC